MDLDDLRRIIQKAEDMNLPGNTPVKLAKQHQWPFTSKLSGAVITPEDEGESPVIYLAEAAQEKYLPELVLYELRKANLW